MTATAKLIETLQTELASAREEIAKLHKQPFCAAPSIDLRTKMYCDGWNCERKTECGKYSLKPVAKAAYWARKEVDEDCMHFEVIK